MTKGLERCETGQHEYQPRYDERAPNKDEIAQRGGDWMVEIMVSKDKLYVCDICTKCGNIIARK